MKPRTYAEWNELHRMALMFMGMAAKNYIASKSRLNLPQTFVKDMACGAMRSMCYGRRRIERIRKHLDAVEFEHDRMAHIASALLPEDFNAE